MGVPCSFCSPTGSCRNAGLPFESKNIMRHPSSLAWFVPCLLLAAPCFGNAQGIEIAPIDAVLRGKAARQHLIVTTTKDGKSIDRTRDARFESLTPKIVAVNSDGIVTPVGDGAGSIVAHVDGIEVKAAFKVIDGGRDLPVTFEHDVQPILARFGCNAGACHGKARGQNGFQLSLLGFDPDFDFNAITQEARGRRVFPASPENSLLLRKAVGAMPHGGGRRLQGGRSALRRAAAAGSPPACRARRRTPRASSASPSSRASAILTNASGAATRRDRALFRQAAADVTHLATFQSNESVIAAVEPTGCVKAGPLPGEAAIMARFMEKFAVCNVVIPLPKSVPAEVYAKLPRNNFIDGHVWDKLQQLGITPSEPCSDATFHRRAYLDVIGRLPTPDETRAFLADQAADKRAKLVDRLLERPEYADYWANKWADLLRPNPYRVGIKAMFNLDAWLRDSFRQNKPYDQFVREIVTAQGSTFHNGAVVMFRDRREPDEITTMVSQLFLGVRLECAKCHHHPFEVWGQDDFYSFAAYFARIGRKGQGISPPISGGEEIIFTAPTGKVKHPAPARCWRRGRCSLLAGAGRHDRRGGRDPREVLADWIVSDGQPVLREGDRQPRLGRPDGPRPRRAGGRPAGHQPAEQRPAARRPGRGLPQEGLRPEEAASARS